MRNEQGFSLIELLIVVAIIAIIAAIAVPSLLTSRMAANEASAIQGCRTIGSAEIAFAATSNQQFDTVANLVTAGYLDSRFSGALDGYRYTEKDVTTADTVPVTYAATTAGATNFAVWGDPDANMGRFSYGIGTDQVVRYMAATGSYTLPAPAGTGLGAVK